MLTPFRKLSFGLIGLVFRIVINLFQLQLFIRLVQLENCVLKSGNSIRCVNLTPFHNRNAFKAYCKYVLFIDYNSDVEAFHSFQYYWFTLGNLCGVLCYHW